MSANHRLHGDNYSAAMRLQDCAWLASNPEAGSVIPGSGGCRKVRWTRSGSGKQGGVRVIYFTRISDEEIWLLVIYSKAVKGNIPAHILKAVREEVENE